jgi:glycosyltransferase involved in cell wall biosynthesis
VTKSALHLFLYLDQGTTLDVFSRIGTLDRELAVYRRLVEHDVQVSILSWSKGEDSVHETAIRPIELIHNTSGLKNRIWMARQLLRLKNADSSPKVLMTNQLFGAPLAAAACRLTGIPFLVRLGYLRSANMAEELDERSMQMRIQRIGEKFTFHHAKRIVATTLGIQERITAEYAIDPDRITILPNYVDQSIFKPAPERDADPKETETQLTIVTTSRLSPEKNIDVLIKAAAECGGVRLVVIGDGPMAASLRDTAKHLDVPVSFRGIVANDDLPGIYAEADAFALVSQYEGHPKSLIEAMSCGLPVLGSRVRGIAELIDDGTTGLLAEPDPKSVAGAIEKLRSKPLRHKLGAAAHEFARTRFDLNTYTSTLLDILHDVSASPR